MTSCAPDGDIDGRYYGIGPAVTPKSKKKFSKRHTPKDKTPPHMSVFDDHMEGSPYKGEDLCPHCGYPRSSTVYCTVSHLHHGNDTPLTPTHGHGGTSPSSKSKKKSHKTPKQHSRSPTNGDENSPHKGPPEYLHGATYSIGDAMITVSAASSPHGCGDDEAAAHHDEGAEVPAGEEGSTTQYYCYTDENGDTYYYAAEMKDTVPNSEHHHAAAAAAAETAEAPAAATTEELESHPQVYVYTYEDENGVQQTVMVQGEADPEECEEDDDDHMMSDEARDGGSQQEDLQASKTKKKKRTFASTISNLFQRRNRRASRTDDSEDGEGHNSGLSGTPSSSRRYADPASGLSHLGSVDEAVLATVEAMEPADRKKFEKERRRLVKELEENEKTQRSKLIKKQRQYVDDLVKERRACMQNLRGDDGK